MDKLAEIASSEQSQQIRDVTAQLLDAGLAFSLNLLAAATLLIAGMFISSFVSKFIRVRLEQIEKFDRTLIPFLAQMARFTIMIFAIILVLAQFGIQTTSIIAVLGAAGLAIGLALQGTLQNVAAGVMLLIIRPFKVGDFIETSDASGTVDAIGFFMTRMHRVDNIFVAVPNSNIWSGKIINYSMRPRRRMDILIGISYDDDIDEAVEILKGLLKAEKRIMPKPAPLVVVKALGESSVDLEIRAWTKRTVYWDLRFDTIRAIKYALDEAGISIPYPHRQLVIEQGVEAISGKGGD